MNLSRGKVSVNVTEKTFDGEESENQTVYGISLTLGEKEKHVDDLSCNRRAVEDFARRLSDNSVSIESIFELAEDFLEELYGVVASA